MIAAYVEEAFLPARRWFSGPDRLGDPRPIFNYFQSAALRYVEAGRLQIGRRFKNLPYKRLVYVCLAFY